MEPLTTEELKIHPNGIRNPFSTPKLQTQEAERAGGKSGKHGVCVGAVSCVVGIRVKPGASFGGGELGLPSDEGQVGQDSGEH